MICDCPCEKNEPDNISFELKSEMCHKQGDLSCGICSCYKNFFGKECECDTNNRGLSNINEFACRKDNTSTVDCSGRGSCECNQCECDNREDPNEVNYIIVVFFFRDMHAQ